MATKYSCAGDVGVPRQAGPPLVTTWFYEADVFCKCPQGPQMARGEEKHPDRAQRTPPGTCGRSEAEKGVLSVSGRARGPGAQFTAPRFLEGL